MFNIKETSYKENNLIVLSFLVKGMKKVCGTVQKVTPVVSTPF